MPNKDIYINASMFKIDMATLYYMQYGISKHP